MCICTITKKKTQCNVFRSFFQAPSSTSQQLGQLTGGLRGNIQDKNALHMFTASKACDHECTVMWPT